MISTCLIFYKSFYLFFISTNYKLFNVFFNIYIYNHYFMVILLHLMLTFNHLINFYLVYLVFNKQNRNLNYGSITQYTLNGPKVSLRTKLYYLKYNYIEIECQECWAFYVIYSSSSPCIACQSKGGISYSNRVPHPVDLFCLWVLILIKDKIHALVELQIYVTDIKLCWNLQKKWSIYILD